MLNYLKSNSQAQRKKNMNVPSSDSFLSTLLCDQAEGREEDPGVSRSVGVGYERRKLWVRWSCGGLHDPCRAGQFTHSWTRPSFIGKSWEVKIWQHNGQKCFLLKVETNVWAIPSWLPGKLRSTAEGRGGGRNHRHQLVAFASVGRLWWGRDTGDAVVGSSWHRSCCGSHQHSSQWPHLLLWCLWWGLK